MIWFTVDQPAGKKIPEWMRTIGWTDEGVVFVPAMMGGNEQEVVLCLAYDNTEAIEYLKHCFVPADWMAKEFPHTAELCSNMVMTAQYEIRRDRRAHSRNA